MSGRGVVAVYGGPEAGALMLVRYAQSGVGPYDELLWVSLSGAPQVTRIVVSTQDSVEWGRRNWAIPKSRADFAWEGVPGRDSGFQFHRRANLTPFNSTSNRWCCQVLTPLGSVVLSKTLDTTELCCEQVRVTQDGRLLAHLSVRSWGPSLPVTTAVVPAAWRTLVQPPLPEAGERAALLTTVSASGRVRPARLSVIGGNFHPALLERRPLLTVAVPDFRMVFPVPRVWPA
nr:hypothetical protein [Deinococcus sp. JMULE3]